MKLITLYDLQDNPQSSVYNSGDWIDGVYMEALEAALKSYLKVPYVILTNSGTSALLTAYWILRNKHTSLTVDPYTFPATYQPARLLGYDVRFERSLLENHYTYPEDSLSTITHLFGQPNKLLSKIQTDFIEDACQSFGAEFEGKKVGTFGTFGCFSFYPTKTLYTCGHGGALVTKNKEAYEEAKIFIESGRKDGVMTNQIALNLRLDEIKAEFLLTELKDFDNKIEQQRQIANIYKTYISKHQPFLVEPAGSKHIYSVFNIFMERRDEFRQYMQQLGIQTAVYYNNDILPSSQRENYDDITKKIVAIPCRSNLTQNDITRISRALQGWYS